MKTQMIEMKTALVALGALFLAAPVLAAGNCDYQDTAYSHGSTVCQSGSQYRCNDGRWDGLAVACDENPPAPFKDCMFNGNSYSPGSASCQSGTEYRCNDGAWRNFAIACTSSGDMAVAPIGRTCMYDGATVATQSSICKAGITFLCEDGEWRNLGTACR